MAILDEKGHEILDTTPITVPTEYLRAPSTLDEIKRYISMVNREVAGSENESFEEADDFAVGDDYDPSSPWELSVDEEEHWKAFREEQLKAAAQREAGMNAGVERKDDGSESESGAGDAADGS